MGGGGSSGGGGGGSDGTENCAVDNGGVLVSGKVGEPQDWSRWGGGERHTDGSNRVSSEKSAIRMVADVDERVG